MGRGPSYWNCKGDRDINLKKKIAKKILQTYLDEREFCLARLLVDEVVVVLGRDVERVALLCVELRRVQHHRDLPLQDHEDL